MVSAAPKPHEPAGLGLGAYNKAEWDQPETRRRGLRELHRLHRYGLSLRAPRVLPLETRRDFRLHDLERLRWFLSHPFFTALLVLEGQQVLLEEYAADFGAGEVHSIQSITKTSVHLIAGALVEAGRLDAGKPVTEYLPEVAGGYARVSVQDAMDMAVVNDYTEDFYDPAASVGLLEDAHGWRIAAGAHVDIRTFLRRIGGAAGRDPQGRLHYKSANTDVVAWCCERAAQRSLRELYLEIIEACGPEGTVYLSTDRLGTPFAGGGLHMTLRDLGRYGLLLARGGASAFGARVGSATFRDAARSSRAQGSASLLGRGHYRSFFETDGSWLGHNGYGGQWLMVWPESEIVVACLSGIADDGGLDWSFIARLAALGEDVAGLLAQA